MAEVSDRYALPLLQTAQGQKEVTHNEALTRIDALLHLGVETATLSMPPAAPDAGTAWIVAIGSTGAWSGRAGHVASWTAGGWRFVVPRQGCVAWLRDVQRFSVFTASGWRDDGWPAAGLRIGARLALAGKAAVVSAPAGGAVVDLQARAAIADITTALRTMGVLGG